MVSRSVVHQETLQQRARLSDWTSSYLTVDIFVSFLWASRDFAEIRDSQESCDRDCINQPSFILWIDFLDERPNII